MGGTEAIVGDRARSRGKTTLAVVVVLALCVGAGGVLWARAGEKGPTTRSILDGDGNLAMPMPRLASGFSLTPQDDGSTLVDFQVAVAVSTTTGDAAPGKRKADAVIVHTNIADHMSSAGPIRLDPIFTSTQMDQALDEADMTRSYEVRLPPGTTQFLQGKGLGSDDPTAEQAALEYVNIAVQQIRDYKVEDGQWDWQQGRAWTAADQPVQSSVTRTSSVSVTNNTAAGLYDASNPQYAADGSQSLDPTNPTDAYGTDIMLSGQPVQCIAMGNGSDPQGFSLLNGWDIEQNLPPGMLPAGATITEEINDDDSTGEALAIADDVTEAALDLLIFGLGGTTPGVQSMITSGVKLKMGIEAFSSAVGIFFDAAPIGAILALAWDIYKAVVDSCADYANIFNLTAVEPNGATSSYSWADQTNGFWANYQTATHDGSAVTNNVALGPSTGIISGLDSSGQPETVNPWLAQIPSTACGTDCASGSNNIIDVVWSTGNPCPQTTLADCTPTATDLAALPEVTVPGTDLCGPSNALCAVPAAPVPAGASPYNTFGAAEDAYGVLEELNPPTPILSMAVLDDGQAYAGGQDGSLYEIAMAGALNPVASYGSPITAMVSTGDEIVFGLADGNLVSYDGNDGTVLGSVPESGGIDQIAIAGDALYLTTSSGQLWFYAGSPDGPNQVVADWGDVSGSLASLSATSITANDDYLFVGFPGGWVQRCTLTDCPGTWSPLTDGGFQSDVNALTTLGNTVFAGLANGAIAQINAVTANVLMMQQAGEKNATIADLVPVDGYVYVGGCMDITDPVTTDLLGVTVLTGVNGSIDEPGFDAGTFDPTSDTGSCYNSNSTDSNYNGFQTSQAALATSKTWSSPGEPAVVYQAFTIDSGNFLYVLENLLPPNPGSGLCIESAGDCPTPPPTPTVAPATTPPPASALGELPAPQITSSCDISSAYTDGETSAFNTPSGDGLQTIQPASTITSDGFQLRAAVADTTDCTTTFAWNLNNYGSLPYETWMGNAYLDADVAPGSSLSIGAVGTQSTPLPLTANGATPVGPASVGPGGTQLAVDVSGAAALVLSMTVPAGSDGPAVVDIAADTLLQTGQQGAPTPLAASSQPCTYPRAALASQATVLYQLDDTGTTAADSSGHGNDGTIVDAVGYDTQPGPNAACPQDGALLLDGQTTHVLAPSPLADAPDGPGFSVVTWLRADQAPAGNPRLVANDHTDQTGNGFQLALNSGGAGISSGFFDVGTADGIASANWTQDLAVGTWYQYVGTYDGTTVAAYLNGQLVASTPASGAVLPGAQPIGIGFDPAYDGDFFPGAMADVALVPQALSAVQVQSLWSGEPPAAPEPTTTTSTTAASSTSSSSSPSTTTTTTAPTTTTTTAPPTPPCSFVKAGLAAKASAIWLLNGTGPSAKDYSGNGNTATITDAVGYDVTPGPIASCPGNGGVALGGSGSIGAPASLSPATQTSALTVVGSFQMPSTPPSGASVIIANDQPTTSGNGFQLLLDASGSAVTSGSFDIGAAGGVGSAAWSETLVPGQWYQFVGTYDGTTVSIYLDGQLAGSATTSGPIGAGAGNVTIGAYPNGAAGVTGTLADVAVIPSALTSTQVASLWSAMR